MKSCVTCSETLRIFFSRDSSMCNTRKWMKCPDICNFPLGCENKLENLVPIMDGCSAGV